MATYCAEIARAAAAQGHEVEVWTPGAPQKEDVALAPVRVIRFGGKSSLRLGSLLAFGLRVWRCRRMLRGVQVVLGSYGAQRIFLELERWGLLGRIAAEAELTFLFHGSEVPRYRDRFFLRGPARRVFSRAPKVCATSRYSARLLEESGLLPSGLRVGVALCAIRHDLLHAARRLREHRGRPKPRDPQEPVRVLTLARLHPRKGQLETARALAALPEAVRRKVLYQVGGTGAAAYLYQVEAACREGGVRFAHLGAVPEERLAATYDQCDFHVMTSRALPKSVEGFGLSYLEAGVFGKPSIACRTGGVEEAVLDGLSGILVEEGNQKELVEALRRLIEDAELRQVLGEGARAHALSHDWQEAARVVFSEIG
ncbi:MAG: glycosyltransferase family 4 protein [Verrucomicrobium sp.]|nr:glycosyltransferase family 4 protein [Verrucomicrobium sp.]